MTNLELTVLWIGIAALIALILFTCLYILWKRREKGKSNSRIHKEHTEATGNMDTTNSPSRTNGSFEQKSSKKGEAEQKSYTVNERLDGARVSHRRSHPDRIAQEAEWRERREQEINAIQMQKKRELKNKLHMILSPCNGEVAAVFETQEEAKKYQLSMPGVILTPNDNILYAPVNGVISWMNPNGNKIMFHSEEGTDIMVIVQKMRDGSITIQSEEEQDTLIVNKIPEGTVVKSGEVICHFAQGLIKKSDKKSDRRVLIAMVIHNYEEDQMVLSKRVSYLLHGDKILTLRMTT